MATLPSIPEDEHEEVQVPDSYRELVPETQYDDHSDVVDYGEIDGFTEDAPLTPHTSRLLEGQSNASIKPSEIAAVQRLASRSPVLLSRPKSAGDDPVQGFRFTAASQPQLDLKGTRQGPVVAGEARSVDKEGSAMHAAMNHSLSGKCFVQDCRYRIAKEVPSGLAA